MVNVFSDSYQTLQFWNMNFDIFHQFCYFNLKYTMVLLHPSLKSTAGWGCRIRRLLPCSGIIPPTHTNECSDTKPSDGETLIPDLCEI